MAVEGAMKCVKFLLFFFNFIFWVCGLALIVVGVLAHTSIKSIPALKEISGTTAPLAIIVVGVVIFFIAFFGCCGAWKENHCMVTVFSILLSLIIIVEIGTAIAAYVYKDKLKNMVNNGLKKMIDQYSSKPEIQNDLDDLQKQMHCCGAANYTDWKNYKPDHLSVPDSCCKNETLNCGINATMDLSKINTKGCGPTLEEELRKNLLWVGVAVLVIAFIEIMGVVFACMLMRGIREGYEVM